MSGAVTNEDVKKVAAYFVALDSERDALERQKTRIENELLQNHSASGRCRKKLEGLVGEQGPELMVPGNKHCIVVQLNPPDKNATGFQPCADVTAVEVW